MSDWFPALFVLWAAYCLGGLHGLWLAWTQEARMGRWAAGVSAVYSACAVAYDKGGAAGAGAVGAPASAEREDVPPVTVPGAPAGLGVAS